MLIAARTLLGRLQDRLLRMRDPRPPIAVRTGLSGQQRGSELRLISGIGLGLLALAPLRWPSRLFGLDPAEQVLPADRGQEGRMVAGHMPPDRPDHLVVAIAAGHESALAPDQLRHRASPPSL